MNQLPHYPMAEAVDTYPLASCLGQFKERTFWPDEGEHYPGHDSNVGLFFYFVAAQMFGTGSPTPGNTISCTDIWDIYLKDWRNYRKLFEQKISFDVYEFAFGYYIENNIISLDRLVTRYHVHQHLTKAYSFRPNSYLRQVNKLWAYGIDPLGKKLNLLRMILSVRPDVDFHNDGGPIIDYHTMRVILRYYDLPVYDDPFTTEAHLRLFSYDLVKKIFKNARGAFASYNRIDSMFYGTGRKICTYEKAHCDICPLSENCAKAVHKQEPRIPTLHY